MSHYCKICGLSLPNEKFSGKGHAAHICKSCHRLPAEKREELQIITRIDNLHFDLSKANRRWLEQMKKDPREAVRREAEAAWDARFTHPFREEEEEEYSEEEGWEEDAAPSTTESFADVDITDLPF